VRSRSACGVAMAALVVMLAVACGGSEGKPGGEKLRYINQADPICSDTFSKAASYGNGRDKDTLRKRADLCTAAGQRLLAIPRPKESVELATQFATSVLNVGYSYDAAAQKLAVDPQANVNRDLQSVADIKKDAAKTAKTYGFKECTRING